MAWNLWIFPSPALLHLASVAAPVISQHCHQHSTLGLYFGVLEAVGVTPEQITPAMRQIMLAKPFFPLEEKLEVSSEHALSGRIKHHRIVGSWQPSPAISGFEIALGLASSALLKFPCRLPSSRACCDGAGFARPHGNWIGVENGSSEPAMILFFFNKPAFEQCLRTLSSRPSETFTMLPPEKMAAAEKECHQVMKD